MLRSRDKLYQNIVKAASLSDVASRFTDMGLVIVSRSPPVFAAQIKDGIVKKGQLIRDSGAKPD